ncbi:MAG: phosphotransferase family protein [Actinomycetota bacterium]
MNRRLLGQGREAEIFEWEPGTVLRLLRDPSARERAEHQAAAIRAASGSGAPVAGVRDLIEVDGRPGLVLDRVDGPALMDALARRPWRLLSIARTLGEVHARVHEVRAPDSLPEQRAFLRERIEAAPDDLPGPLRSFALRVLEGLPGGDRLCHGDYHVSNVLAGPAGPVVIDWTLVCRGHPTGDFARSLLLTRFGEVPPGTPLVIRTLRGAGQGVFNRAYERAYRRKAAVDDPSIERWQVAHVAARFSEGIMSEYRTLTRFLEARAPG